jgi:hypothetical protein
MKKLVLQILEVIQVLLALLMLLWYNVIKVMPQPKMGRSNGEN